MDTGSNLLFVYGTLKMKFQNEFARKLRKESEYIGEAYTFGHLYKIDWYPGLIKSIHPEDKVTGELYRMKKPAATLKWLDEYEGRGEKDDDDFNFYREITKVYYHGLAKKAWVFFYQGEINNVIPINKGVF